MQAAARTLGLELHILRVSNERDLNAAFAAIAQLRAAGLVVGGDPFLNSRSEQIAILALRQALPSIYPSLSFVAAGGLLCYGRQCRGGASSRLASTPGGFSRARSRPICRFKQTTKVEFVINMKTAKALGINMPLPLLGRADEVIE